MMKGDKMITEIATSTNAYKEVIEKNQNSVWVGSIFEHHKGLSSKAKGSWGERLACDILEGLGANVPRRKNGKNKKPQGSGTDFDIYVDNKKIEVKTSFAWDETEDSFTWQQIRDQEYEYILFVGVNPNECKAWFATKNDLIKNIFGRNEYRQHAGKDGEQDLYWIQTKGDILDWFIPIENWGEKIDTIE
jgi:hypothetical protein